MAGKEAVSIKYKAQPMDCALHPSEPLVAAGLISGRVQVHRYDAEAGKAKRQWSVRTHTESCRAVALTPDGTTLATGSADACIVVMDMETGKETRRMGLATGISRLLFTSGAVLASGGDDGRVCLTDLRGGNPDKAYAGHSDFVSDLAHVEGKRTLLATSGDGTLSAIDLRTQKVQQSDTDADDELLSLAVVKGGAKIVAGTQSGMLDIWSWGHWAGFSDRFPGHPSSVDSMVAVDQDTVITGSADGLIRVLSIQPHKMLGVVGQHPNEEPVERLSLAVDGSFLASAGHDSCVHIWDTRMLSANDDGNEEQDEEEQAEEDEAKGAQAEVGEQLAADEEDASEPDSDADEGSGKKRKRRKKLKSHLRAETRKKTSGTFFRDLL